MVKDTSRDEVCQAAATAATIYVGAAAHHVDFESAALGGLGVWCYLMVAAGMSAQDAAECVGLPRDLAAKLIDATEQARIKAPAMMRWLASVEARMPRLLDQDGDAESADLHRVWLS